MDESARIRELEEENRQLKELLEEAEENLRAINRGEVDAFIINSEGGDKVFTLAGADTPYRLLIEDMSEGAATLSKDALILYCNSSFANMLRTPLEEIIGSNIHDYVYENSADAFRDFMNEGKFGEGRLQGEFRFRTSDGFAIPVYVVLKNMLVDSAKVPYIIVLDLTRSRNLQRRLRESEERFRNSVENLLSGFGIIVPVRRRAGEITDFAAEYVNPANRYIVEVEPSEMIGRKLSEVLPGFKESKLMEAFESVMETGKPYVAYDLLYEDIFAGIKKAKYLDVSVVKSGDAILLSWRDVTQRHEDEKVISDLHRMESVSRMGAMIAHDLRNPLNLISQSVEAIDKYPDMRQRMLQMVKENTDRALKMIEELRLATREIELNPRPVNLASFIHKILTDTKLPATVEATVEAENLGTLNIDPDLMRRVLDNLISNSLDAMPEGGKLILRTHREGDYVYVSVKDTGVGIAEDEKPKMWEPFHTTKTKGFGLGLPFCRRAVEAHGGTITFKSAPGQGTTFTMRLPLADQSS